MVSTPSADDTQDSAESAGVQRSVGRHRLRLALHRHGQWDVRNRPGVQEGAGVLLHGGVEATALFCAILRKKAVQKQGSQDRYARAGSRAPLLRARLWPGQ